MIAEIGINGMYDKNPSNKPGINKGTLIRQSYALSCLAGWFCVTIYQIRRSQNMIICLGPFCVPVWNLLLLALSVLGPIYNLFFGTNSGKGSSRRDISGEKGRIQADNPGRDEVDCQKGSGANKEDLKKRILNSQVHELGGEYEWELCKEIGRELNLPIVLEFYTEWCRPCKQISPKYHKLCEKYKGIFVKVNYDNLSGFSAEMNVTGFPTFHIWTLSEGEDRYNLSSTLKVADADLLEELLVKNYFESAD